MNQELDALTINGVGYVRSDSIGSQLAEPLDGMPYCIVRTYSAGVFAGYVESRNGKEAVLRKARRIWYWKGAASLSQLSQSGTSKPKECKFPEAIDRIELTEVIEVDHCTEKAKKSIEGVPIWKE